MVQICIVGYTHYQTDSRVRREADALVDRGEAVDLIRLVSNDGVPEFYDARFHGVCRTRTKASGCKSPAGCSRI